VRLYGSSLHKPLRATVLAAVRTISGFALAPRSINIHLLSNISGLFDFCIYAALQTVPVSKIAWQAIF